jgi:uncharacterized membrane protein
MDPKSLPANGSHTCSAIRQNIDAVARLQESFDRNRTFADWAADEIGGFTGSIHFVIVHFVLFGAWILINVGWIPFIPKFDPFPFLLLSAVVSLEAIFLSTFVLMKQNRMSRREELRAHLDLQINLLAEREMTLVLQLLQRISTRLGINLSTREIEELTAQTSVEALATELQEKLPDA